MATHSYSPISSCPPLLQRNLVDCIQHIPILSRFDPCFLLCQPRPSKNTIVSVAVVVVMIIIIIIITVIIIVIIITVIVIVIKLVM
jgi:hypothetical protein